MVPDLRHLHGLGKVGRLVDGNVKNVLRADAITFISWRVGAFKRTHLLRQSGRGRRDFGNTRSAWRGVA